MTEPQRSSHDIVTIKNIDDEDFTFEYDRSRGNYPYTVKAGAVARFPRFLADHAVKHLIDKILTKRKTKTNNEATRADVAGKIYIGEEIFQQKSEDSEAERTRRQVEQLNKPSDLENVIAKAKSNAPAPEKSEEVVVGSVIEPVEESKEVKEEPKKPLPTKSELFDYAVKQGLILDEPDKEGKTLRERLTKMKVAEAIAELQYPI